MIIRRWINKLRNRYSDITRLERSSDPCPECGGKLKQLPGYKMCSPPIESWQCIRCDRLFEVQDREKYPGVPIDISKPIHIEQGRSFSNVEGIAKLEIRDEKK